MAFYDNPQYHLFFDGATSGGNPGTGGCGAYWYKVPPTREDDERGREQYRHEEFKESRRLGYVTNNAAEYSGLILGVRSILKEYPIHKFDLVIHGDSELVIKQIKGEYEVRNQMMKIYYKIAIGLLKQIKGSVSMMHIPRRQNGVADELAKTATQKPIDRDEVLVFYPSRSELRKLKIDGRNFVAGTDTGAAGNTYENLIDATTLVKLFGSQPLRALKDPGRTTILQGAATMTVLGILAQPLQCLLEGNARGDYIQLSLNDVVVVDFLPYDVQISVKNPDSIQAFKEQFWPGHTESYRFGSSAVDARFHQHPFWNDNVTFLPM